MANIKRKRTPEQRRRWHLNWKYGLSQDAHDEMLRRQGGACGCCGDQRKLVVDHNHATGAVRGLICDKCNIIVGFLEKNPKLVGRILASYLKGDGGPELLVQINEWADRYVCGNEREFQPVGGM